MHSVQQDVAHCALRPPAAQSYGPGMDSQAPKHGILHLDGWAGRRAVPVLVHRFTPRRVVISSTAELLLPGRRVTPGTMVMVPRYAVAVED